MNTDLKKKLDRLQKELELIVANIGGGGGGGDASAANQVLGITELQNITSNTSGSATAANQVLGITELQSIASGSVSAETTAFKTTALLANNTAYDSVVDWDGNVDGYSQVQTEILASHDGIIDIQFFDDAAFTDLVRRITIPYVAAEGYQFFAAPAFGNFIQYVFLNTSGVTQTDFYYTTKILTTAISPQLLTTGAFIAPAMVATLGRNIIVGQDENGVFGNVSVTETTNDAGTYKNLNVVSGARPSELAGRVKVSEVVDTAVSVLQRTITAGKTFFITDIVLTIDNSDTGDAGRVNFRDGLTVAGATVLPIQVQEAPTNETAVQVVTHTFAEPIEFSTGLFIEEGIGINIVTGVVIGYEE
tara:strand:+ start:1290 stop:2375 length:1086 start_codon:yes stop_codon:yes gene_type:complete